MISGLDLKQTVDFTLKDDKENPTIWKLGVLPSDLYVRVLSELSGVDQIYTLAQLGIKGWSNFNQTFSLEKKKLFGEELEVVPLSSLRSIPQEVIAELSMKIMDMNKLSAGERKN